MMLLRSMLVAASIVTLSPLPASAARFCYYWVTADGNAETYERPPLSLAAPPFYSTQSLGGHLVIGLAQETCRRSELVVTPGRPTSLPASAGPARNAPIQQNSGGVPPTLDNTTNQ